MGYSYCKDHGCESTNGCWDCERENALPAGWQWEFRHGHYRAVWGQRAVCCEKGYFYLVGLASVPAEVVQAVLTFCQRPC